MWCLALRFIEFRPGMHESVYPQVAPCPVFGFCVAQFLPEMDAAELSEPFNAFW